MKRTRLSLFYLAGYLIAGGVALMVEPQFALRLLFANHDYGDVMPRFAGVLLTVIGMIVVQIIRHRLEMLYLTTLFVRAFIVLSLSGLYVYSRDRLFLVLIAVVGLGMILTGTSYLFERGRH
jgi:uncharacterized protein YjeT (DUF2065 family)